MKHTKLDYAVAVFGILAGIFCISSSLHMSYLGSFMTADLGCYLLGCANIFLWSSNIKMYRETDEWIDRLEKLERR